jgi:Flp pilus assembly pilin Flp
MFKKGAAVLKSNSPKRGGGSYFVEMALVLVGVALAVFTAASNLSTNGIVPKYNSITTEMPGANSAGPDTIRGKKYLS